MIGPGKASRKSYEEGCLAAHALDLIGDRWALLVVRELMLGPKRFGGIRAGIPGVSANILTRRLEELEAAGILARRTLPLPAGVQVYGLTVAGQGLRPVIEALCRWGGGMPGHEPRLFISPTSLMLSMGAMIDRAAARGLTATAGFGCGPENFATTIAEGVFSVTPVEKPRGSLVLSGTTNALAAAVYGAQPLADMVRKGMIDFAGDIARGQAFVDLFSLRPKDQTARSSFIER